MQQVQGAQAGEGAMRQVAGEIGVYIAARTEDQIRALAIREAFRHHGIRSTARWLDLVKVPRSSPEGAIVCWEDIVRADVFLLLNPLEAHRTGTGGRHVETGISIGQGKPTLIYGAAENVFHTHPRVQVVPDGIPMHALAAIVKLAAHHGTPLPVAVAGRTSEGFRPA